MPWQSPIADTNDLREQRLMFRVPHTQLSMLSTSDTTYRRRPNIQVDHFMKTYETRHLAACNPELIGAWSKYCSWVDEKHFVELAVCGRATYICMSQLAIYSQCWKGWWKVGRQHVFILLIGLEVMPITNGTDALDFIPEHRRFTNLWIYNLYR